MYAPRCRGHKRLPRDELEHHLRRNPRNRGRDLALHQFEFAGCELTTHTAGDHADYIDDIDETVNLWIRWTDDGRHEFVELKNCPDGEPPRGDGREPEPCTLFLDHGGLHSWQCN
ncbi:hypothetical protein [Streptomyces sp. NPDC004629]|uniref:hypothetical protein n=1 Tax=Streptomyces sp. NPDC004629 TaxID=3364705 RepID=UPI0036A4B4DA